MIIWESAKSLDMSTIVPKVKEIPYGSDGAKTSFKLRFLLDDNCLICSLDATADLRFFPIMLCYWLIKGRYKGVKEVIHFCLHEVLATFSDSLILSRCMY